MGSSLVSTPRFGDWNGVWRNARRAASRVSAFVGMPPSRSWRNRYCRYGRKGRSSFRHFTRGPQGGRSSRLAEIGAPVRAVMRKSRTRTGE